MTSPVMDSFSDPSFASILVTSLLLLLIGFIVHSYLVDPLRGVPGPFWASVSRLWLMQQVRRGDLDKTFRKLHHKLGPSFRESLLVRVLMMESAQCREDRKDCPR